MYLKRLDIAGFKSFATRTAFEFGQGITAIVGPNGSGKSNIADALRWVLGEQSGRLLRARKLEDVIFAGSSKRPPADKAELTITLDNSDGWLPLEFAEVAISRRAYRSGESDYLINRKRVRLRDVQDLLLRAQAGQNSYAIIGQGLVETVLNLRPEERRQLIEEAADIQRYRLKIEEAQNRLAATRENTERVKLLIKEISPRLGQLERQARRASEHVRISRELAQALQAWYEHQWHHAQETLTVARAAHDQAQAEHTQARLALDTCQRELASISQGLDKRRAALSTSAAERQALGDRVHELEQRLALNQQRQGILQARKRELEDELRALESERASAAANVFDDAEKRAELGDQITATRVEFEKHNQALTDLEEEFRGMQDQAGTAEEKAARLRAAAADTKDRVHRLTSSQGDLVKDTSRLETRRRSLVSQMAEVLRVLRSIRTQEAELSQELAGFAHRRQDLQTEIQQTRKALTQVEANQHARRASLEALQARLQVIREAQEQYRSAQAESQPPEPSVTVEGLQAAVHQIIRVPRGLETAIESALADYVEALVVNHQKEAINAARAIAAQGASRAHILPLDSIKEVYPLNILKERGIVGVASKLVKSDPRYQGIVDALLGRTIVVQDVETAVRILRRGMGTVVTLEGIVLHPLGSVSAGWPRAIRPFVLGHERDLEAIPKEMDRVRRSLEASQRQAEGLRNALAEREAQLARMAQDFDAVQGRWLRTQEAVAERQQRLAHLRGELRGLIVTRDRLREQGQGFLQEADRLGQERERLLAEAREADNTARYLRKAIAMVDSRRQAILHSVTEASARLATLEGELQSLAQLRQQSDAAVARLDAQLSAKQVQRQGLAMELSSLASTLQSDAAELEQAQAQLQAFAESYEPERDTIAQSEARERELHSQLLSLQGRLLQAERRVLETEAEVRRWETELPTLRQHIEDDGLTITDAGDVIAPEITTTQPARPGIPYWLAVQRDQPDQGPRPIAGGAQVDPQALGQQIERLRGQLRQLGPVNVEAQADYQELKERHDFLAGQMEDLHSAERSLHRAIGELTEVMRKRFGATFAQVAQGFEQYFEAFFGGGHARLVLSDGDSPGVDIVAQPPGKRLQSLAQLSGGEKALTAVALLFALVQASPSPFCVLDEVDAMLDDANVGRFVAELQELSKRTQFIVITHNRKTIEVSDAIYGVSMGPDSASQVLSLRLAEVKAN